MAGSVLFVATFDVTDNIAAEVDGGKHGKRHRFATFAPQETAASTRRATVVSQMRREQARLALLRRIRH